MELYFGVILAGEDITFILLTNEKHPTDNYFSWRILPAFWARQYRSYKPIDKFKGGHDIQRNKRNNQALRELLQVQTRLCLRQSLLEQKGKGPLQRL